MNSITIAIEALERAAQVVPRRCGCRSCVETPTLRTPLRPLAGQFMILCSICGNKRCPRAAHHDNPCTGSNEPGQPGSDYP